MKNSIKLLGGIVAMFVATSVSAQTVQSTSAVKLSKENVVMQPAPQVRAKKAVKPLPVDSRQPVLQRKETPTRELAKPTLER